MKDASRVVAKYQQRVAGAGPDYAAGVQTPKRDWLDAYKAAQPRMQAGIQAAMAAGTPVKNAVAKGGTQNWQNKAANKGARNYAGAAPDAAKGYEDKVQKVLEAGEIARKATAAMPNTTMDQRLQRMVASAKAIHDYWNK